ncbi:MAG: hypothetical protein HY560_13165 [Gemmatimonadetes bacterium]|nr:hypothetical protein [Gemmatimonadota bacterium]
MRRIVWLLAVVGTTALAGAPPAEAQISHSQLMGTWQIIAVKNLKTGEVDSIANRRLIWTQYTRSRWTYVWSDTGRQVVSPAELGALPRDSVFPTNYGKIWDREHRHRFWGSGGEYWLVGDSMYYTNVISIEPYMLQLGGVEHIAFVNDTAYVYHSVPDRDGVVREYVHRRLGRYTPPPPPARRGAGRAGGAEGAEGAEGAARLDPRLLQGTWQVMSVRNTRTGEVEQVAQRRVNWFHLTGRHWTYVWMTKDRPVVTPDELARLAPEDRMLANYRKVWDDQHRPVFWASGGTYRVEDGKFIVEPRVMSIEPWMVGVSGVEPIVRLDRQSYIYRSPPDAAGVIRETVHRRIE